MATGEHLPGLEPDDEEPAIVLHVDADCFYAACERLREPALEGEPVVVGMGYEAGETGGAVATASYEAREHGVESAQAIETALERLPRRETSPDAPVSGIYRPVDMDYYESVAGEVSEILEDVADVVRRVSIDEAYLDVTDRTDWSVADGFARHVKDRIRRAVGVTVSVGVAPSMSVAKIASDYDKPDGLTVVEPEAVRSFLEPLPVDALHGVGPVTASELRDRGLETAGDVAAADPGPLIDAFGERGRELYEIATGQDDRSVEPRGLPKSFSRESAFGEPPDDHETVRERVRTLAASVADRATREGALYRTIGIKVVTPPYEIQTRERTLPGPIDEPPVVRSVTMDLLEEFTGVRIRKVGVRVANLEFSDREQAGLDGFTQAGPEIDRATSDRQVGQTTLSDYIN